MDPKCIDEQNQHETPLNTFTDKDIRNIEDSGKVTPARFHVQAEREEDETEQQEIEVIFNNNKDFHTIEIVGDPDSVKVLDFKLLRSVSPKDFQCNSPFSSPERHRSGFSSPERHWFPRSSSEGYRSAFSSAEDYSSSSASSSPQRHRSELLNLQNFCNINNPTWLY
ncbi:PREDICTED: uncharacterized protein LOC105368858 [Ceratosolen solmsi marchali]|uniref:Uncharacterized protein LOC105368858 n=1 Tax=Ceratosolen solmsi marchali TaxID=326594 RepID=A0AAJ7E3B4_9HYME|nr:PREDICTED: uncharacterized protein LOC105368858 [Ceratosolen solmsi marchali]